MVDQFDSAVLRDNPLGDSAKRNHIVYLPPGYDEGSQRYPVIFCLAGFTGTSWSFTNYDPFVPTLPQRFETLMREGRSGPAIMVMVDGMTGVGGNQYINSEAVGRHEDHIIEELVPYIDREYRTLGDGHRGVKGKSSGGYGAMMHAFRHSDVWSVAACHSGDMYFEYCYLPDFPGAIEGLKGHEDVAAWFRSLRAKPKLAEGDHKTLNALAMAAFYSPKPNEPMGIDLPFDRATGRMRDEVWARWLQNDPVRLVEQHADALRSLKLLYIDCGTKDQFNLQHGARILVAHLQQLGVKHHYEEFDDTHMGIQYRYDVSLPLLVAALSA